MQATSSIRPRLWSLPFGAAMGSSWEAPFRGSLLSGITTNRARDPTRSSHSLQFRAAGMAAHLEHSVLDACQHQC